jgi:hypothetical protein
MTSLLPFAFRGRVSPRQATYFSLLRQRKVGKRKATLLSATLRCATGNLRCSRFAGSRRTRFAQTAASPDPRNAALLGAARRAWGPTRHRCARRRPRAFALLGVEELSLHFETAGFPCSASIFSLPLRERVGVRARRRNATLATAMFRAQAERSNGPIPKPSEAMARVVSTPLWLRRGAERFADQGRSCLSEASSADPAKREHRRLPRSAAKGSQTVGSPFFCLPFFGEAKKSRSPAGARPGLGKQIQKGVPPAGAGR